jgi:acyl carrier protein phosphodiesterase
MNFLAHAYLSFNLPDILAGNMLSDFIKGKKKFQYSSAIQKGISLHRMIDDFTDQHEATKNAKEYFRKEYGLYSGPFIDIVFDHFLANDPAEFTDASALAHFSQDCYNKLEFYSAIYPEKFKTVFFYMKKQDWLYQYRFNNGIINSFIGLVRRSKYLTDHKAAEKIFLEQYKSLEFQYQVFFPQLKSFSKSALQELLSSN